MPENELAKQSPTDTSSLPLWQRRYLGALQGGLTRTEALSRANITAATISEWTTQGKNKYSSAFARAEALVASGIAIMGVDATRDEAIAVGPSMISDAVHDSRDPNLKAGPRLGNRRLVLEVGGSIQSRNAPGAAIQINVFESGSLSQHLTELRAASKNRARGSQQSSGESG